MCAENTGRVGTPSVAPAHTSQMTRTAAACSTLTGGAEVAGQPPAEAAAAPAGGAQGGGAAEAAESHRAKLLEATRLEDLAPEPQQACAPVSVKGGFWTSGEVTGPVAAGEASPAVFSLRVPPGTARMPPTAATATLRCLSRDHLCAQVPCEPLATQLMEELYKYDQAISLVLTHYWSCFNPRPPKTDALRKRAAKMAEYLEQCEKTKLRDLLRALKEEDRSLVGNLQKRVRVAVEHWHKFSS